MSWPEQWFELSVDPPVDRTSREVSIQDLLALLPGENYAPREVALAHCTDVSVS